MQIFNPTAGGMGGAALGRVAMFLVEQSNKQKQQELAQQQFEQKQAMDSDTLLTSAIKRNVENQNLSDTQKQNLAGSLFQKAMAERTQQVPAPTQANVAPSQLDTLPDSMMELPQTPGTEMVEADPVNRQELTRMGAETGALDTKEFQAADRGLTEGERADNAEKRAAQYLQMWDGRNTTSIQNTQARTGAAVQAAAIAAGGRTDAASIRANAPKVPPVSQLFVSWRHDKDNAYRVKKDALKSAESIFDPGQKKLVIEAANNQYNTSIKAINDEYGPQVKSYTVGAPEPTVTDEDPIDPETPANPGSVPGVNASPAEPGASAPAESAATDTLPTDRSQWQVGKRYKTIKGDLTWDGKNFVQ